MIDLDVALKVVHAHRRDTDVVIATMAAARAWMQLSRHPLDMIFVPSSMGHATSFGLGIALAQPRRRVIVLNGDGSLLMNLGTLITIAAQHPPNLHMVLFDNGVYEVTGAQPLPGRPDYLGLAHASGIGNARRITSVDEWTRSAKSVLESAGPSFVVLDTEAVSGRPGPRSPGDAAERARKMRVRLVDGPSV
jgi:thiamine pyrophosphate-dependent acetolactate synthase large subunit-like protein